MKKFINKDELKINVKSRQKGFDHSKMNQVLEKLGQNNNEMFYQALFQTIDGVCIADLDGVARFINPSWAAMHGLTVEECIGKKVSFFHSKEQLSTIIPIILRELETKSSYSREVGHMKKDGSTFPTWMTSIVLVDQEGEPYGRMAVIRDIHERKKTFHELSTVKEITQLSFKQATNRVTELVHELKNPLSVIKGSLGTLEAQSEMDVCREKLKLIQDASVRLEKIIHRVLNNHKASLDAFHPLVKAFSLEAFLADLTESSSVLCKAKNLSFYKEMNSTVPEWVKGDEGLLRQVLDNLINNAIKNTESGKISLNVNWDFESSKITFRVKDTGRGMSEKDQKNLFASNKQFGSEMSRRQGHGVGLHLCQKLTGMIKGELKLFESKLGKGSTFELTVPLEQIKKQDAFRENIHEGVIRGEALSLDETPQNILVAEDDMAIQALLRQIISNALPNCTLSFCVSGQGAIDILSKESFDLVLLDYSLAEGNGSEVYAWLKKNKIKTHVVFLSANSEISEDIKDAPIIDKTHMLEGLLELFKTKD